jgi:hypothetical protein
MDQGSSLDHNSYEYQPDSTDETLSWFDYTHIDDEVQAYQPSFTNEAIPSKNRKFNVVYAPTIKKRISSPPKTGSQVQKNKYKKG